MEEKSMIPVTKPHLPEMSSNVELLNCETLGG